MKLNCDCIHEDGNKKDCRVSEKGKIFRLKNETQYKITVFNVDAGW